MADGTPVVYVDVDGVLNRHESLSAAARKRLFREGWRSYRTDLGRPVFLNPDHGLWLLRLAQETGAELAWGSTWQELTSLSQDSHDRRAAPSRRKASRRLSIAREPAGNLRP